MSQSNSIVIDVDAKFVALCDELPVGNSEGWHFHCAAEGLKHRLDRAGIDRPSFGDLVATLKYLESVGTIAIHMGQLVLTQPDRKGGDEPPKPRKPRNSGRRPVLRTPMWQRGSR